MRKSKRDRSRIAFLTFGTLFFLFGTYLTIERISFYPRSDVMTARVVREWSESVEVLPERSERTVMVERAITSRHTRMRYAPGRVVEIRADTSIIPHRGYMNSFYSYWFMPLLALFVGLLLLLLGYSMPKPWRLPHEEDG